MIKEKNTAWSNVLPVAIIIVAMLLVGTFSGVAAAADTTNQQADDQYKIRKERYEDTKRILEDSYKQYRGMVGKFRPLDLKEGYRNYLVRANDHFVAYLEVLKYRLETAEDGVITFDASGNIDAYVKELEQIRAEIKKADTGRDLINITRELRDVWLEIRLSTKYYLGILWNQRVGNLLEKADNVSARVSDEIQKLKAAGKDTSELEAKLAKYNELIGKAEVSHKKAEELYATPKGFDANGKVTDVKQAEQFLRDANKLLTETNRYLKEAYKVLREIFNQLKKHRVGEVDLWGTGMLEAKGTGRAVLTGNLTVEVSGNGTLIVSSNANVTTSGNGTKTDLGNGNIKYQGYGNATITGENIRVEISGNNIELRAEGTGSASLSGTGSYKVERAFAVRSEWIKSEKIV